MRFPARTGVQDSGSAIHLFPVGVLAVLVLGAMAVDAAVVHLATRQALDTATSAADGAVVVALDRDSVHEGGGYRVDPSAADAVARRMVSERNLPHRVKDVEVDVGGDGSVSVRVTLEVEPILGAAIPGNDATEVSAVGRASPRTR